MREKETNKKSYKMLKANFVAFALAFAVTVVAASNDLPTKEELCRQILKGDSRLFFHIFCSEFVGPKAPVAPAASGVIGKKLTPAETCERLCSEGNGGAVCDCSGGALPPAVAPPQRPKKTLLRKAVAPLPRDVEKLAPRAPLPPLP